MEEPLSYEELLRYAQQNISDANKVFEPQASFSLYDAASPYYGNQMQAQYEAASAYADQLAKTPYPRVTIPQSYYEQVVRKAPIVIQEEPPILYRQKNIIGQQSPADFEKWHIEYGKNKADLAKYANWNINELSQEEVSKNLLPYWRDALEHEAGHIGDYLIKFNPSTLFQGEQKVSPSALTDYGYMSEEGHLVTGLGKVQREHYAMTGKRFESPREFKEFIFNLAKSQDFEEEISSFSAEARRALRPQIENAKHVKKYYDALEKWQNSQGLFKKQKERPSIQGNPELLEKSAELIPALVQVDMQRNLAV